MPEKTLTKRRNPHDPVDSICHFISVCAKARKDIEQFNPETIKANAGLAVAGIYDKLDEDSQSFVKDLIGIIGRPK